MPPASLPAMPAMSPGPMTARNASEPAARNRGTGRAGCDRPRRPRSSARSRDAPAQRRSGTTSVPRRDAAETALNSARRRQLRRGRTVSIASSTVTIPTSRPVVVDDRDGQQVVAGDDARRPRPRSAQHVDRDRLVDHDLADRRRPGRATMRSRSDRTPTQARRRRRRRRRSRSSPRRARARAAGRSSRPRSASAGTATNSVVIIPPAVSSG